MSIALPLALWAVAVLLARREWRQYRAVARIGHDLFVYSKGRLVRRLIGCLLLAALGVTLFAFGVIPPSTPAGVSTYMALMLSLLLVLLVLPLVDLWETARTARPHDLTRQADRPDSRRPPGQ